MCASVPLAPLLAPFLSSSAKIRVSSVQAQTFADPSKQTHMVSKKIMEINPRHPIITELRNKALEDARWVTHFECTASSLLLVTLSFYSVGIRVR